MLFVEGLSTERSRRKSRVFTERREKEIEEGSLRSEAKRYEGKYRILRKQRPTKEHTSPVTQK